MRLTPTEYAVLGLLTFGERSGYDLRKLADHSVGYFWTPAKSRIYATLPRLVDAGLVTRREIVQSGKPDKQLYRLTAAGEAALREWIAESPTEPDVNRNTLLVRVFFGDLVDFVTRSPVFPMVVEGPDDNTWLLVRKLVGATKATEAEPGSIRGDFATVTTENLVHASDGHDSAAREMALWFPGLG